MLSQSQMEFISEHYTELYSLYKNNSASSLIWDWLKTNFSRECWNCPRKIHINISNLLKLYGKQRNNTNTKKV